MDPAAGKFDVGRSILFQHNLFWPYFERLRREAPVHFCNCGEFGNYWSITKYKHILQIEANHEVFSSDVRFGGITLRDQLEDFVHADVHRHGPAEARPAARRGAADRGAG